MSVKELNVEGLSRSLQIEVTQATLTAQLDERLDGLKNTVQLKGFRPGKVPAAHLKNIYGKQLMAEIIQQTVTAESQKAIEERNERPALQPEITPVGEIEAVVNGAADLVLNVVYEIIPDIALTDFSKIEITRPIVAVEDAQIDEAVERLADSRKTYKKRGATAKARKDDSVKIDFLGRVGGEAFEGGSAQGHDLVLGSGQFIPGFEDQLIGTKAKDTLDVTVTFPEDYGNTDLAGKEAVFEVTVHEVSAPEAVTVDDEFASSLGFDDVGKLRAAVTERIEEEYSSMSRTHLKKNLLDKLDALHKFDLPPKMVDLEFDQIWHEFTHNLEQQDKKLEDMDESEEDLRAGYRVLAARRVRTGLVLTEVGTQNDLQVTNEELNRALMERLRQFPGQEQEALKYFQENPQAMAQIRAPLFEDKVVDFICEMVKITDEAIDRDTLLAGPQDDVVEASPKKASNKPKTKKAAPKKTAAKKATSKTQAKQAKRAAETE